MEPAGEAELLAIVEQAARRGFVGRAPAWEHLQHALGFAEVGAPSRAVDLGSGGGLPGLPLAVHWPASRWILVESNARRGRFLREAVHELGLGARVQVHEERAEIAAHHPEFRSEADLVVARSFGPPAVTAECAAGFLRVGGHLVVSEPPGGVPERWEPVTDTELGLQPGRLIVGRAGTYQVLTLVQPVPSHLPRRPGVPGRRPLF